MRLETKFLRLRTPVNDWLPLRRLARLLAGRLDAVPTRLPRDGRARCRLISQLTHFLLDFEPMRPPLLLLTVLFFATLATATALFPGETVQITFATSSPSCPSGPCDALLVSANEQGSFFANGAIFQLFNGMALLGTVDDTPFCCSAIFRSSTSLSTQGTVVDFTAIDSGAITGVIDYQITSGELTWTGDPTPLIMLAHASGPGSYLGGTGFTLTSVQVLVPEPKTVYTAFLGIGLLCFDVFRRRSSAMGSGLAIGIGSPR
jgi:hypothetical protein